MSTDILDEARHPSRAPKRPKPPRNKLPTGERLLDVHDAASMLGLKSSTLYQWAYERKIPVVKLFGRALRFRLSVIEKLIADSERPALSSARDRIGESSNQ
jgi:excisionase family DNA binding protein